MVERKTPVSPAIKRRKFVIALKRSANVSQAALAAKISTSTAYRWRNTHETFRAAWDDAINAALDNLEAALLKRAVNGVEKPIMYGGKQVNSVTTYSDNLAMFLLRAKRPQIYGREAIAVGPTIVDQTGDLAELERKLDIIAAHAADGQ